MTKIVLEKLANNVPIISVLEGGYDMKGLLQGLNSHLKALQEYSIKAFRWLFNPLNKPFISYPPSRTEIIGTLFANFSNTIFVTQ